MTLMEANMNSASPYAAIYSDVREKSMIVPISSCVRTGPEHVDDNNYRKKDSNPRSVVNSLVPASCDQLGGGARNDGSNTYQYPISTAPALNSAGRIIVQLYPVTSEHSQNWCSTHLRVAVAHNSSSQG